jgi:hypothetical protein
MEPTRIELDLPITILNQYGNLEMPNHHPFADIISGMFERGTVMSLHFILETTGGVRGFCEYVDPNSTYKSICGWTLDANGVCDRSAVHVAADAKHAESIESEESE